MTKGLREAEKFLEWTLLQLRGQPEASQPISEGAFRSQRRVFALDRPSSYLVFPLQTV